jgi:hypothetical protein
MAKHPVRFEMGAIDGLRQASSKIGFEARGGLLPVLGIFCEELHDDGE